VRHHRRLTAFLAVAALACPLAACGEEDVRDQANELEREIDAASSKKELREAAREVEKKLESGSGDAKREARRLERKIERELNERR
jgi:hypothetical protein